VIFLGDWFVASVRLFPQANDSIQIKETETYTIEINLKRTNIRELQTRLYATDDPRDHAPRKFLRCLLLFWIQWHVRTSTDPTQY
jgi:hypothetical protein